MGPEKRGLRSGPSHPLLNMNKSFALPIHLALATCLSTAFLGLLLIVGGGDPGADLPPSSFQVKQGSTAPNREGALGGFAAIVEGVKPCVVCILSWAMRPEPGIAPGESDGTGPSPSTASPAPDHDATGGKPSLIGMGSGVILTSQGHILTNHHVVAEAQWIWVMLPETSERLSARVLGKDADTDLAVLKIEKPGLRAATFGDSDLMKAGDVVLAIGNPFGLSQTVTSGIVSATSRSDLEIAGFENFIQTDASINPGNSGGALINSNGDVIGINTAIFSRNGANVGVGFAISGNLALKIARRLVAKGEVARGYLGIVVAALTPELAKVFRVTPEGVLVNDVSANSPAAGAGYRPGDVIIAFNGSPVQGPSQFRMAVADLEPGSKAVTDVVRQGKIHRLEAILSRNPDGEAPASPPLEPAPPSGEAESFLHGIFIQELTPALRLEHGVPFSIKGVMVSYVAPVTVLQSGLRPGMVICEILGQAVDSVPKALEARSSCGQEQEALLLRIWIAGKGYQFAAVHRAGE